MQQPANPFDPRHFRGGPAAARRSGDDAALGLYLGRILCPRGRAHLHEGVELHGACRSGAPSGRTMWRSNSPACPSSSAATRRGCCAPSANTCRHRGSKIARGAGNTKAFMCPYHGWCYALDGALTAAVDMGDTKGFRNADHGLIPIKIDSWGGFIFVNFDPDCESLQAYLGDLPDNLASHRLGDMANTRTVTFELNHNWKLFVENAKESYHIAVVHRETINQVASVHSADYAVSESAGQYCTTYCNHDGSMAAAQIGQGIPQNRVARRTVIRPVLTRR